MDLNGARTTLNHSGAAAAAHSFVAHFLQHTLTNSLTQIHSHGRTQMECFPANLLLRRARKPGTTVEQQRTLTVAECGPIREESSGNHSQNSSGGLPFDRVFACALLL